MSVAKALGFVGVGLLCGVVVVAASLRWYGPEGASEDVERRAGGSFGSGDRSDVEGGGIGERVARLEEQVALLTSRLEEFGARPPVAPASDPRAALASSDSGDGVVSVVAAATTGGSPGAAPISGNDARERTIQRLIDYGFTYARAEALHRRQEELLSEFLQARYDAERRGEPSPPDHFPDLALRRELGEAEYEQLREALGQPTAVAILTVLQDSAAARGGIREGDRIVSYAGQRVYDGRELMSLLREGTPGESVMVEVERDGGIVQIAVPRGPLGVSFPMVPVLPLPSVGAQ